ncbi:MAG: Flp family type IVb pilin [Actinomycetales bacterium]|nr:Flp family type IVb pilin [Actinomycetales bacterium]
MIRARQGSDDGASAVEYGLLVAAIAAVIVAVVITLGQQILGAFTTVNDAVGGIPAP